MGNQAKLLNTGWVAGVGPLGGGRGVSVLTLAAAARAGGEPPAGTYGGCVPLRSSMPLI
jgi:hypothetical protein